MTLVIGLGLTCHHIHYFPTTKDTRKYYIKTTTEREIYETAASSRQLASS